jgi:electron transfer flavoprotein alpha subunit
MPIGKVWVLAEKGDSGPTPVTLELLTEARSVASTVEAVAWGDDVATLAGPLGEYGATTAVRCRVCPWPPHWPRWWRAATPPTPF